MPSLRLLPIQTKLIFGYEYIMSLILACLQKNSALCGYVIFTFFAVLFVRCLDLLNHAWFLNSEISIFAN